MRKLSILSLSVAGDTALTASRAWSCGSESARKRIRCPHWLMW